MNNIGLNYIVIPNMCVTIRRRGSTWPENHRQLAQQRVVLEINVQANDDIVKQ